MTCSKGTILLFAPHPDDETLGCGGYVAKRIDDGYRVVIVVLTMGEKLFSSCLKIFVDPSPAEIRNMRRDETLQATAILGVPSADVLFLTYEDGTLAENTEAAIRQIIPMLHEMKPAEVLCTGPYEEHPDHQATSTIVQRACAQCIPGTTIRWYITKLQPGVSVNELPCTVHAIDITQQLGRKTQAVAQFQAHLAIVSPQQTEPMVADFRNYLADHEILLSQYGEDNHVHAVYL